MGMRGPRPLPRELKIARGTIKKSREPATPVEAVKGTPTMPSNLSDGAARHWKNIVSAIEPWGILAEADGELLRLLVLTLHRIDVLEEAVRRDGYHLESVNKRGERRRYKNPDATSLDSALSFARQCLAELGCSPSSRGRIEVGNRKESSYLDKYRTGNADVEKFFA